MALKTANEQKEYFTGPLGNNEVKGVNRVLYDCTGKPPATIEFE